MLRPCSVYVFGPLSRPCKVGIAFDPKARAQMIRCNFQSYIPTFFKSNGIMWFVKVMPCQYEARIVERVAHALLDDFRIIHPKFPSHRARCEWFDISQEMAIEAINLAVEQTQASVCVNTDWLERLEAWINKQPIRPSKSEVIRVAVDTFISQQGKGTANAERKQPAEQS